MILKNTYNSHHTENNGGPNEKEHPSSDFQARLMAPWFFIRAQPAPLRAFNYPFLSSPLLLGIHFSRLPVKKCICAAWN
jgi:hypothetical protein